MKYAQLTPLKQLKALNRKIGWAFDIETRDGLKGKEIFCWSLATKSSGKNSQRKVFSGKSMKSFFQILQKLSREKEQIIYIHNQNFDSRFIIDYCVRNEIKYNPFFTQSTLLILWLPELHFKFLDSFQLLLCSQENAEIVFEVDENLRKIDCKPIFEKDFKLWTEKDKQLVIEHNKNDVLALQQIMQRYREKLFEVSNVDLLAVNTLSVLALKSFRKKMQNNILNPYLITKYDKENKRFYYELEREKYNFVRQAYYGGRTECLNHNYVTNVIYYDKVSMFPAQMKENLFPDGIPNWTTNAKEIWDSLGNKFSIIEAKLIPNYSEKYPILPFRKEGKTLFANLNEIGVWTNVEIEYALERGYFFEFYRALIFPKKTNDFDEFINTFFTMKEQNKGAIRLIAKHILNRCYGKFGQKVDQERTIFKFFIDENEGLDFHNGNIDNNINSHFEYNDIYEKYFCRYTEESKMLKAFQIEHLSIFITAYARIELTKMIHLLSDNEITVYYCDTDSIVAKSNDIIELGKKLGNWDIECSFAEFLGLAPKCYIARFDNSIYTKPELHNKLLLKVKGIRRDKINEIVNTSESIIDIHEKIKEDIVLTEQYMPIKSALVQTKNILSSKAISKTLSLIDNKRVILADNDTIAISDLQ